MWGKVRRLSSAVSAASVLTCVTHVCWLCVQVKERPVGLERAPSGGPMPAPAARSAGGAGSVQLVAQSPTASQATTDDQLQQPFNLNTNNNLLAMTTTGYSGKQSVANHDGWQWRK